ENGTFTNRVCAGFADFCAYSAGMGTRQKVTLWRGEGLDPDCVSTPRDYPGRIGHPGLTGGQQDFLHSIQLDVLIRMPKVASGLHGEPALRAAAKGLGNTQRHLGTYSALQLENSV